MKAYLDNAATTPILPEAIEVMQEIMGSCFGNPSSIHWHGRQAKTCIEKARRSIAKLLGVAPGELFFTSGGTEADNMALNCAVRDLGVKRIITSRVEHHAVLHVADCLADRGVVVEYVELDELGHVRLDSLEAFLTGSDQKTLVSLMHANNEIGNLIDLERVGSLCKEHNALFHTDSVQTVGHLPIKPKEWNVDFMAASAHKFHGPKGIGFIFINEDLSLKPFIYGGSQERNMRGGTENLIGIVGMSAALNHAYEVMDEEIERIGALKKHMALRLQEEVEDVRFNGDPFGRSNYIALNVSFPQRGDDEMLLFNLDIAGVSASGGSACSSGSNTGSHVVRELKAAEGRSSIRFSFGKFTTLEEIDFAVDQIKKILA